MDTDNIDKLIQHFSNELANNANNATNSNKIISNNDAKYMSRFNKKHEKSCAMKHIIQKKRGLITTMCGFNRHLSKRRANDCAANGDLDDICELRKIGVHCTSKGADYAAQYGHIHVLHDLHLNGIHCTTSGADSAAQNGHLDVVCLLEKLGVHCSKDVADVVAMICNTNALDVIHYLRYNGISHVTRRGADFAARNGSIIAISILEDIALYGVKCTSKGADYAARNGHLVMLQFLYSNGVKCSENGMALALANKQYRTAIFLRGKGLTKTELLIPIPLQPKNSPNKNTIQYY
jgi:hypothetical protein